MAKLKAADAVAKVVSLLESVDDTDRRRVIGAVLTLLGEEVPAQVNPPSHGGPPAKTVDSGQVNEKSYFDSKQPDAKIEELAVAARFREEYGMATSSTQADLQGVIRLARRNFDAHNFKRDLENARGAGLFTRGTGRDLIELSHYGQSYVDALPNRDEIKQLHRPKSVRRPAKGKKARAKRS